MLQNDKPKDYVVATGITKSIRDFVEEAFKYIGVDISWRGHAENEEGFDSKTNRVWIKINPIYYRATEVEVLQGDSSLIRKELGWKPKTSFEELVQIMMEYDCGKFVNK